MPKDPLDKDALMENVDQDAQILADLAQTFRTSWPKHLAALRDPARNQDAGSLASEAHRLVGGLGVFCAREALDTARALEEEARHGKMQDAPAECERLAEQVRRFQDFLDEMVRDPSPEADPQD